MIMNWIVLIFGILIVSISSVSKYLKMFWMMIIGANVIILLMYYIPPRPMLEHWESKGIIQIIHQK
jgi:amino acid permease